MKKYLIILSYLSISYIFALSAEREMLPKHESAGNLLHVLQKISSKYQKTIIIETNINIKNYKFTLKINKTLTFGTDVSIVCDTLKNHTFYESNEIIYIVQDGFREQEGYMIDDIIDIPLEEENKIPSKIFDSFFYKNRILGMMFHYLSFSSKQKKPWYIFFSKDKNFSKLPLREFVEDGAKSDGNITWIGGENSLEVVANDISNWKKFIRGYGANTELPLYIMTAYPGYKLKKEKVEDITQKPKVITEKDIPKRGNHLVDVKLKIIDVIINEKSNSYFEITLKNKSKEKLFFKDMFSNLKVHNWACPYSGKGLDILCLFYPPKDDAFIKENILFELNIDEEKILKFPIVGSRMQLDVAPSWFDDKSNGRTRDGGKEYKEYLSITPNFQMECKKVYPGNSFKAIIRFYDKDNILYKAFEKKNIPFYPKDK